MLKFFMSKFDPHHPQTHTTHKPTLPTSPMKPRYPCHSQNSPLCCAWVVCLQKDHFQFWLVAAIFVYIYMKCRQIVLNFSNLASQNGKMDGEWTDIPFPSPRKYTSCQILTSVKNPKLQNSNSRAGGGGGSWVHTMRYWFSVVVNRVRVHLLSGNLVFLAHKL